MPFLPFTFEFVQECHTSDGNAKEGNKQSNELVFILSSYAEILIQKMTPKLRLTFRSSSNEPLLLPLLLSYGFLLLVLGCFWYSVAVFEYYVIVSTVIFGIATVS